MAAAQIPGGRLCRCGCGRPVDPSRRACRYTRECSERVRAETQRAHNANRDRSNATCKRYRERRAAEREKLGALALVEGRKSARICPVCCGMPWARLTERLTTDGSGFWGAVSHDGVTCRGCGEPYAPEPPVTAEATIGSSGGTAARHGELFGTDYFVGGLTNGRWKASR
jgi:hypothetical protein